MNDARRCRAVLVLLELSALLLVACGPADPSMDAAVTDTGVRADARLDPTDAATPEDSTVDSGVAPGAETLLIVGLDQDVARARGAVFRDGAWSALEEVGSATPVGVAVLPDGRGLLMAATAPGYASYWTPDAGWGDAAPIDAEPGTLPSSPAPTSSGALLGRHGAMEGDFALLTALDAATTTWGTPEITALARDAMPGQLVVAAGSEPFLFEHTRSGRYRFTRRAGGTWTEPDLVGSPIPSSSVGFLTAIARGGSGEVLAGYVTGTLAAPVLSIVRFDGAWEPVTALPVRARFFLGAASMATLPGDRVAVAVMAPDGTASVAILEATGGSPTAGGMTVPGVTVIDDLDTTAPIAVARGTEGAILELAYIAPDGGGVMHTRLLDEASWSWSAPVSIPGSSAFLTVFAAAGP